MAVYSHDTFSLKLRLNEGKYAFLTGGLGLTCWCG